MLALYRSDRPVDPKISKAVQAAEGDATLRNALEEQTQFDARIVGLIRRVQPAPTLREKLDAQNGPRTSRARHAFNPAILCAVFGVLLIIGLGVHFYLEADKDFPGRDSVETFIVLNERMTGAELEQTKDRKSVV